MENFQLEEAIKNFDIVQFLEEHNIEHKFQGKNIGIDWIGVSPCINKLCGDTKYHFGIHKNNKYFSCWNCGWKGNLIQFIAYIKHISKEKAKQIILTGYDLEDEDLEFNIKNILRPKPIKVLEPEEKYIQLPESLLITKQIINNNYVIQNFLKERRITKNDCSSLNFRIGLSGYEKNKLIIPIRFKNKLVAYQTRAFNQKQYRNIGPIHNYLYKIDKIKPNSQVILVEGIFDYLSLHKFINKFYKGKYNVTTMFSKNLSFNQIKLIIKTVHPKKAIYMLDNDAWFEYSKTDSQFICPTDFIILPKNKDPADLDDKQMLRVFMENKL